MSLEVDETIPLDSVVRAQKQWIDAKVLPVRRGWVEGACLIVFKMMTTPRGTSYNTNSYDLVRIWSQLRDLGRVFGLPGKSK